MVVSRVCVNTHLAGILLLAVTADVSAQRSIKIDQTGSKWTVASASADSALLPVSCNAGSSSPYWLDISGNTVVSDPVEVPVLTFSGYSSLSPENVVCQYSNPYNPANNPFNNDPLVSALVMPEDYSSVRGERYTFFTLNSSDNSPDSLYSLLPSLAGLGFTPGGGIDAFKTGDTAVAFQWEFTVFNDSIIGRFWQAQSFSMGQDGLLVLENLPMSDSTTYVRVGTQTYGGATYDLANNYLCFSSLKEGGDFIGVISPDQVDECRSGNPATVPLPGTLGLLGIGLAALWGTRRRVATG